MRASAYVFLLMTVVAPSAHAEDAVTFSLQGEIGLGWLDDQTVQPLSGGGRSFEGFVLFSNAIAGIDVAVSENLSFGAVGRVTLRKGQQSNYDSLSSRGVAANRGTEFNDSDLDLAVYLSAAPVVVSYGEMDTAFDLATLELTNGRSSLDGGNALWMNIGDASGSIGARNDFGTGPAHDGGFKTLRADFTVGDMTLSFSQSRGRSGYGSLSDVKAAGFLWESDFEGGQISFGAGYDRGPDDKFNSLSFALEFEGLKFELSRIHRSPILVRDSTQRSYDIGYSGMAVSYDFGDLTLGAASAEQQLLGLVLRESDRVFPGNARAIWASWEASERVKFDFEWSENDYRISTARDTSKASIAVSLSF